MSQEKTIKDILLENGVKNLIEFGYPAASVENVLTDEVYALFFKEMLNDNKGKNRKVDLVIDSLLETINKNIK